MTTGPRPSFRTYPVRKIKPIKNYPSGVVFRPFPNGLFIDAKFNALELADDDVFAELGDVFFDVLLDRF